MTEFCDVTILCPFNKENYFFSVMQKILPIFPYGLYTEECYKMDQANKQQKYDFSGLTY